jgi:TetR/AcrR family transcriptional regulator, repressor for neighboring sulfatase
VIIAEEKSTRTRVDTEEKLIRATAELLGEVGPNSLSIRAIAERAGVNHGLVHHYFGGKDALLRAAMEHLVHEHHAYAMEHSRHQPLPAPFALLGDPTYLRAVVRAVLDNEMSLARTELTEEVSVPRNAMMHLAHERGNEQPSTELKAKVGLAMAMEMGWAALEPFILSVVDASSPEEQERVRVAARRIRNQLMVDMVKDNA